MEPPLRQLCKDLGLKTGQVLGIIRVATSGKEVAPPLFGSLEALGRHATLQRLRRAEDALEAYIQTTVSGR
jgi:glutamyl-tRNA synthetase